MLAVLFSARPSASVLSSKFDSPFVDNLNSPSDEPSHFVALASLGLLFISILAANRDALVCTNRACKRRLDLYDNPAFFQRRRDTAFTLLHPTGGRCMASNLFDNFDTRASNFFRSCSCIPPCPPPPRRSRRGTGCSLFARSLPSCFGMC